MRTVAGRWENVGEVKCHEENAEIVLKMQKTELSEAEEVRRLKEPRTDEIHAKKVSASERGNREAERMRGWERISCRAKALIPHVRVEGSECKRECESKNTQWWVCKMRVIRYTTQPLMFILERYKTLSTSMYTHKGVIGI